MSEIKDDNGSGKPEADRTLQIAPIGDNLNQIEHRANTANAAGDHTLSQLPELRACNERSE